MIPEKEFPRQLKILLNCKEDDNCFHKYKGKKFFVNQDQGKAAVDRKNKALMDAVYEHLLYENEMEKLKK